MIIKETTSMLGKVERVTSRGVHPPVGAFIGTHGNKKQKPEKLATTVASFFLFSTNIFHFYKVIFVNTNKSNYL